MHPLIGLWLMVLASTVLLSGFFYLAENYAHIIGNFYFIAGAGLTVYILMLVFNWRSSKNKDKKSNPFQ